MSSKDPFSVFEPLMTQCGATCAPQDFHWKINEIFHTIEAEQYDELHASMFSYLDRIWARLLRQLPPEQGKIDVLDIGSGTGLVGLMLNRLVPQRIGTLTCVEPNLAMIGRAKQKSERWAFPVTYVHGILSDAPIANKFDVVTINSVLHHIVDLEAFLGSLSAYVNPGALLLTAQDPRAGAARDDIALLRRKAQADGRWLDPLFFAKAVMRRVHNSLWKRQGDVTLADKVNEILLKDSIIQRPLDMASIYSVTDVHVPGQPGNIGAGLDPELMQRMLKTFHLRDVFTYQFFGREWALLNFFQQRTERKLWGQGDRHGFLFGTAWQHIA